MLRIFKILGSLVFLLVVAGIIVYFLPSTIKVKGMGALAGIVPESFKEQAAEFLLTPAEKRTKLIGKLETNLAALDEDNLTSETTERLLQESDALIEELKAKNKELSLGEIAKTTLVQTLLGNSAASSSQTLLCEK